MHQENGLINNGSLNAKTRSSTQKLSNIVGGDMLKRYWWVGIIVFGFIVWMRFKTLRNDKWPADALTWKQAFKIWESV